MLKKGFSYQFIVASATAGLFTSSLACACGSETAAPTSRAGTPAASPQSQSPGSGTATSGTASPAANGMNGAMAGSGSPVLQPSTATGKAPRIGDPNVCEIVQLVTHPQVPDMMIV